MSGWEAIVDPQSPVWMMYVNEINRQARSCMAACNRVLELGDDYRHNRHTGPSELTELRDRVEQAISDAASLRNLIYGGSLQKKKRYLEAFHDDRVRWLQRLLGDPELPTIRNVDARDSMVHFDERMDEWAYAAAHRPDAEAGWMAAIDWIVKSRDIWGSETPTEPVRCYIADEMVFVIRDVEVHIPKLMAEANTVIQRIRRQAAAHTTVMKSGGMDPAILLPL
ncbi:hypothetical protein [Kocuria sp. U4B]